MGLEPCVFRGWGHGGPGWALEPVRVGGPGPGLGLVLVEGGAKPGTGVERIEVDGGRLGLERR